MSKHCAPSHGVSRRQFLAVGATGAASLAAGVAFAAPAAPAPLRVAVVGCGMRGQEQIARLIRAGARVALAVDPGASQRRAAQDAGAESVTDEAGAAFADGRIDAVLIATPDAAHGGLAALAAAAGKHVYVERPLAMKGNELRALQATARSRGLAVEVGTETPGLAGWRAAADLVARGVMGPLRWVQVHDQGGSRDRVHDDGGWRADPAQHGGVFAAPFFDMLAPVMAMVEAGAPREASAAGARDAAALPGHMMATLAYANGPTVVLHTGLSSPDGALAVLRGRDATARVFAGHAELWPEAGATEPTRHEAAPVDVVRAWLDAAAGQGTCIFGLDAARRTQQALDKAQLAWRTV